MLLLARNSLILILLAAKWVFPQAPAAASARSMYEKTRYEDALSLLDKTPSLDAAGLALAGQCWYMLTEYKKATDALEKAIQLEPGNSNYTLWLGRAFGRRAETSSFLTAPHYAGKARDYFERALSLNPRNTEAAGDLFDYYLQAPGLLGGGEDKARALAEKTKELDPAEYHYRLAQIADKHQDFSTAEEQLRQAMQMAPKDVGRLIDLAKFLSRQGKYQESELVFHSCGTSWPGQREALVRARRDVYSSQAKSRDRPGIAGSLPERPPDPR